MKLSVWITPFVIVAILIVGITVYGIRKTSEANVLVDGRDEISKTIEEHPFTLNPIIWIIFVATVFIGIVIAYYAWDLG